jgi:hypothetical protein
MKKGIIIFLSILILSSSAFSLFKSDIIPSHEEGLFLAFEKIGYSFGDLEISTNPIFDILGNFNMQLRYYINELNVVNTNFYFCDPFLFPSYFNLETPDNFYLYLYSINSYYHTNININRISLKPHLEINNLGGFGGALPKDPDNNIHVNGIFVKASGQLGYYIAENLEPFVSIEAGQLLHLYIKPEFLDEEEDLKTLTDKLKEESFFVMIKGGIKWYYNDFGFEVGYRHNLIKGMLRFLQGSNFFDYVYNFFSFIEFINSEDIYGENFNVKIPFLTTDYYFSFSTRF